MLPHCPSMRTLAWDAVCVRRSVRMAFWWWKEERLSWPTSMVVWSVAPAPTIVRLRQFVSHRELDAPPTSFRPGSRVNIRRLAAEHPFRSHFSRCQKNVPLCECFFLQLLIPPFRISDIIFEKRYKDVREKPGDPSIVYNPRSIPKTHESGAPVRCLVRFDRPPRPGSHWQHTVWRFGRPLRYQGLWPGERR